jgi:hypothetical protein
VLTGEIEKPLVAPGIGGRLGMSEYGPDRGDRDRGQGVAVGVDRAADQESQLIRPPSSRVRRMVTLSLVEIVWAGERCGR